MKSPPAAHAVLVLGLSFGALACGDDDDGRGAAGTGGSGAVATSAEATTGGSGGAAPRGAGRIDVISQGYVSLGNELKTSAVQAVYEAYPPGFDPGAGCETRDAGPCTVSTCVATETDTVDPAKLPRVVPAGDLTVRGGLRDVTLKGGTSGLYEPDQSVSAEMFFGGETLVFAAAGSAEIPAHTASLVAPARVTVTEPAFDPARVLPVSRKGALRVAWTSPDGVAGTVGVVLVTREVHSSVRTFHSTVIDCAVEQSGAGGEGSVVVPADAMASLLPSAPQLDATLTVSTRARADVVLDDFDVAFVATSNAVSPAGERIQFMLDVE